MITKGDIVKQTISSLKKRLSENDNILQIQANSGYVYNATCTFNAPASDADIHNFEKETGYVLPSDYKEFLKLANGCRLFDDVNYGGEAIFYSLDMIRQAIDKNCNDEGFEAHYEIAYIYQDNIVINSKLVSQQKANYLFWKDHIDQLKDSEPLRMNFELWLDRFIMCQGEKFWWWPIHTASNYYDL
ncbi:SMI1/KNR4 family protein [Priestia koreensis]|uniref:SMI1/KNR4 family protein n=1 Tax=Priestia koreensis TaxID=284581 RepID=UPI001F59A06A|nr:SMI1/KNR4 family protein [Priestia koreensis]